MDEGFTPLADFSGTLQQEALLEQIGGLCSIYWGKRSDLTELLNLVGGGEILIYFFDPSHPLTNLAMARQGNHYYLWIAGTLNFGQWVGNVTGAISVRLFLGRPVQEPPVWAHGFFWDIKEQLKEIGADFLPPNDPDIRITLVGHSLGGAVAQLLCADLALVYGTEKIELLTLAQPRALTQKLDFRPYFKHYHRVRIVGDPVAILPPTDDVQFWLRRIGGNAVTSVLKGWAHYGRGYLLNADGSLSPDNPSWLWTLLPGSELLNVNPAQHYISEYFFRASY